MYSLIRTNQKALLFKSHVLLIIFSIPFVSFYPVSTHTKNNILHIFEQDNTIREG